MNKILSIKQAVELSEKLRSENKKIVLAGGCFDILHLGHIVFLEKAKAQGDILFVWIESDQAVKTRKGNDRPVHTQKERAQVLAALSYVDYIIMLPYLKTDSEYDSLVKSLKPAIIAATKADPNSKHKKRSAKLIHAKLSYVTNRIENKSSSRLAKILAQEEL